LKKKIIFITGSRAEYGIIKNLLFLAKKNKYFQLILIVTGSHFEKKYGNTYKEIINDGLVINYKIKNIDIKNNELSAINFIANNCKNLSKIFSIENPDLVFLTGDRYEMIPAAISATIQNINIAHLHGGEITLGSFDNAIRNSITMMSKYHFVATLNAKKRLKLMGIKPGNIFHVGSPSIDKKFPIKIISKNLLINNLNIQFNKKNILVTYHRETTGNSNSNVDFKILLNALNQLKDTNIFFTGINADPHSKLIKKEIFKYKKTNNNIYYFSNLGKLLYFTLCSYVDVVVGNSSSGLIEIPYLNKPTINLGNRQKNRDFGNSVINIPLNSKIIIKKINHIYTSTFKNKIKTIYNPYYKINSNSSIIKIIENIKLV